MAGGQSNVVSKLDSSVARALASTAGIFSLALWPSLPTNGWLAVAALAALGIARWAGRWAAALIIGACWGVWVANGVERALLPAQWDRDKLQLSGMIVSPVAASDDYWQFDLLAEHAVRYPPDPLAAQLPAVPRKVRLRLYRRDSAHWLETVGTDVLRAGRPLAVVATLRSPRGLANPGLFNYRGWLLSQGYAATGYVRAELPMDPPQRASLGLGSRLAGAVAAEREAVINAIDGAALPALPRALLRAVAVGDKASLAAWRERLVSLGIIHLVVISGLHVGIVGAIGWWLGRWLAAALAGWSTFRGREQSTAIAIGGLAPAMAVGCGLLYTLLAGAQLPAQRALIALCWVAWAAWRRRSWAPSALLVRVVLTIAIVDPLAVISGSFWLSIGAVTLLLVALAPRTVIAAGDTFEPVPAARGRRWFGELVRVQGYLMLGMAPLLLAVVGKLSWLGMAVNLIAVPWVTLLVVPVCLLTVAATLLLGELAQPLWQLAGAIVAPLSWLIEWLQTEPMLLPLEQIDSPAWLALVLCWLGVIAPRALLTVPLRALLVAPVIVLLALGPQRPALRLTVLDVGQGLAAVVEAGGRVLVYDSGARYSDQFDMGRAVVLPYLQRRGYTELDRLLISHADNDHAGGYASLLAAFPHTKPMLPDELAAGPVVEPCQTAQQWQWGEVQLATLSNRGAGGRNDNSCLLWVSWRGLRLLLPGDIERAGERRLLASGQLDAAATVLVAPHHGSKSSSGEPFVAALKPRYTVFSAGWNHHFGHPHPTVVARYQRHNSATLNSAEWGAVIFEWDQRGQLSVTTGRGGWAPWWRY